VRHNIAANLKPSGKEPSNQINKGWRVSGYILEVITNTTQNKQNGRPGSFGSVGTLKAEALER